MILPLLLACTPASPPEPVSEGEPVAVASMGGEPILPRPVVLGGLATADVEAGVAAVRPAVVACHDAGRAARPGLAGKVLLRFTVAKDGSVTRVSTRSTSLRDEATESCLHEAIRGARFPALHAGEVAMVTYPFTFPP